MPATTPKGLSLSALMNRSPHIHIPLQAYDQGLQQGGGGGGEHHQSVRVRGTNYAGKRGRRRDFQCAAQNAVARPGTGERSDWSITPQSCFVDVHVLYRLLDSTWVARVEGSLTHCSKSIPATMTTAAAGGGGGAAALQRARGCHAPLQDHRAARRRPHRARRVHPPGRRRQLQGAWSITALWAFGMHVSAASHINWK